VLTIYNTLTKSKEVFKPLDGNKVRMYVCGMTVYDYCHLGHGRSMVAFDLVTRWLRFSGYDLTYVRNITDIDDKIINRARENGESFDALTERMIAAMHEDEARLNILKPDMEPRATDHIPGMHAMIQTLIDKGYAYAPGNGDVYYRVASSWATASCRARRSKTCASVRGSRSTKRRKTRWTSCCGKASSRASRAGNRRGAPGVRAGTSSAR
jgi:cysteinyl-tRNA synthetase